MSGMTRIPRMPRVVETVKTSIFGCEPSKGVNPDEAMLSFRAVSSLEMSRIFCVPFTFKFHSCASLICLGLCHSGWIKVEPSNRVLVPSPARRVPHNSTAVVIKPSYLIFMQGADASEVQQYA